MTLDEGIHRNRAKLLLKLLFGDMQQKTKTLIEEVCLGAIDEEIMSMTTFENFIKSVLLAKEAFEIAGDIFDHLVLLKGSKVKVGWLKADLRGRILQISRVHGQNQLFSLDGVR